MMSVQEMIGPQLNIEGVSGLRELCRQTRSISGISSANWWPQKGFPESCALCSSSCNLAEKEIRDYAVNDKMTSQGTPPRSGHLALWRQACGNIDCSSILSQALENQEPQPVRHKDRTPKNTQTPIRQHVPRACNKINVPPWDDLLPMR